jgi:regulation of enolase protein 1 (concanavalin A-like superfamily)
MLVQANSTFSCGDASADATRGWKVSAVIRGSANLAISKAFNTGNPAVELLGTNNPYTGNWTVNGGIFKATAPGSLGIGGVTINPGTAGATFEPAYDVVSAGALTLAPGTVVMNLHQNLAFTAVTINGTALSSGTHPFAELNTSFPTYFPSGSGSISVQPFPPPPAPANVSVIPGDSQIIINWSAAPLATSYNVKRSLTPGGPYTTVGTPSATTFTDTGLANGTTYYYVISGVDVAGEGSNSSEVSGKPNIPVTGLTATGGTNQISLSWNSLAGASSYTVRRSATAGGPYTIIASGVTGTTYIDGTLPNSQKYFYVVTGVLPGGDSGLSNEATAITAPDAVTGISAALYAAKTARVNWTSPNPAGTIYSVERSTDNLSFAQVGTSLFPTGYTNNTLSFNTTNYYRVQAQNGGGVSAYSDVVSVITPVFGVNVNFGAGTGNSAGNAPSPIPIGYLQDTGQLYGVQLNGATYGWTTIGGTNIVWDGRNRATIIAPDVRYDTFMHLMKASAGDPSQSAVWEIAVPNGFYVVHVVSDDTGGAVDATYQFNLEGVITAASPSVASVASEFTNTVAVNDGKLTVTSGPQAANNKIAFIDIYASIPTPPTIGTQPQSVSVETFHSIKLTPTISAGSTPLFYQWYLGVNPVQDATNLNLTIPHAQLGDAGDYTLIVTNFGGSATSSVATVTVISDTTPPFIVSVSSLGGTNVGICFNEELATFGDQFSYTVNSSVGAGILSMIVRPDHRSVLLVLDKPLPLGTFTIDVDPTAVTDLAGNQMLEPGSHGVGFVLTDFTGDVGGPALAGSSYSCDGNTIEIVGGGADIWGNSDQGYFATRQITGDFDAKVRVIGLVGSNTITKALLVARDNDNPDAAAYHISVNPVPPGRNQFELGLRSATGGATASWGLTYVPANIPNLWMRMTRAGNTFTGYRSTNGVDWIPMGTNSTVTFGSTMAVGLAVTAHDNTLLATGTFSNFSISVPVSVVNSAYTSGHFSASFLTQPGSTYTVQGQDLLAASPWQTIATISGDGTVKTFTDLSDAPCCNARYYRVVVQ